MLSYHSCYIYETLVRERELAPQIYRYIEGEGGGGGGKYFSVHSPVLLGG